MIYWILPHQYRWAALLAANVIFYACSARFLLLILILTIISFFCALLMEKDTRIKKPVLVVSIVLIVLTLAVFKYADFAIDSVSRIAAYFAIPFTPPALKLLQPLGISFFSFQMIAYLSDVYQGKISACRHFGKYAVFTSFFPTITSGPIERAGHFLPQLDTRQEFDYERTVCGATLLLVGLVKKIVIADSLSKYVDGVYDHLHNAQGCSILIATLLFALQIYCDFSGYSDMAVGLGKLLGFDLIQNFKQPYFATSIREFWASWHISLSTWLKDYIYIPLGGNRKGKFRRSVNLIVTFLISGLWHGANWTFVLWGFIHGTAQVIENTVREAGGKKDHAKGGFLRWLITTTVVCIAWLFFRANSISDAWYALTHLITGGISMTMSSLGLTLRALLKVLLMAAGLFLYDLYSRKSDPVLFLRKQKMPVRWGIYIVCAAVVIILKIHNGADASFIYFQF
ncbi:MAG: MBOAT family protein [Lachnospiraceae bacterium]|nr:MBOAT family protein [Lachnospiraceae bacterium]